jgi:hypothetical protein
MEALMIGVLIYLVYVNMLGAAKVWLSRAIALLNLVFGGFMDVLLFS